MGMFLNTILNSIIQIIFFAALPFIWWLLSARKRIPFTQWIGLKPWKDRSTHLGVWIAGISAAFAAVGLALLFAFQGTETAVSVFSGRGIQAVPAVAVYAVLNTSFPEELLFRGFLLKRLQAQFGFVAANITQSLLFGLLHGALFLGTAGVGKTVLLVLFTAAIAWFMGYINEQKADGSILPSWIIHAVSNLVSGLCAAYGAL